MHSQADSFEVYILGLMSVLERLPVPIALAFDTSCERVEGNRAFRRLIGDSPHAFLSGGLELERRELPLHRAAREGGEIADVGLSLKREDGQQTDLTASAWPLRDAQGHVRGAIAVYVDVTQSREAELRAQRAMQALAESERRYRLITEAMPEFVWLDAPDGSAIYANRRWLDYTGLSEEENRGFGWESVVHPDDSARLQSERERTLQTGEPFEDECRYRGKDGKYRWFLFRSIPVHDEDGTITGWLGTASDIDKQKRAEAQQAFFALASDVLSSTLDVDSTLESIARLAVPALGTWCQIDLPDHDGRLRVSVVAHEDAQREEQLCQLLAHHVYDDEAALGPPAVYRTLKPQLLQHVDENAVAQVIPEEQFRRVYRTVGYASGVMVPLRIRDRALGVLGIASDDPTRLYTQTDVLTALELGRRGATALENAQSFAREHRVATTLQRALLPAMLPHGNNVRFWSAYSAASSHLGEAVGGDWFDAFRLDEERIAISMGDVAGHGVEAAVTMGFVRQAIRAAALDLYTPREVLARANRMMVLEHHYTMITALFGVFDASNLQLAYSLAGHPAPVYVRPDGKTQTLPGSGPPLGDLFDSMLVEQHAVTLERNSALIFFTDGLIEYERDVLRAEQRLHATAGERTFLEAVNPAQAIIEAVLDGPQRDDIAVLVLHV